MLASLVAPLAMAFSYSTRLFVYETDPASEAASILKETAESLFGLETTIFGVNDSFRGFASKYDSVRPHLFETPDDTLCIISDARDVIINQHSDFPNPHAAFAINSLFNKVQNFTGNIVVSAEAQCCVAALTYVEPGDLFGADGARRARACASGTPGCMWNGDARREPWRRFFEGRAMAARSRSAASA